VSSIGGHEGQDKPKIKPSHDDLKLLATEFNLPNQKVIDVFQEKDGKFDETVRAFLRTF